jgi:hypothetical protein
VGTFPVSRTGEFCSFGTSGVLCLTIRFQKLNLPYEFELPKGLPKPAIMFHQPLLGEYFGAGFTKDAGMKVNSKALAFSGKLNYLKSTIVCVFHDLPRFGDVQKETGLMVCVPSNRLSDVLINL